MNNCLKDFIVKHSNLCLKRYSTLAAIILLAIANGNLAYAQDSAWTQVLPAWVDDVYYPTFFLGGNYYTRISLADIDGDRDLDMFYGGGGSGSLAYFENTGTPQLPNFEFRLERFPNLRAPNYYGGSTDIDFGDLDSDGDFDAMFAPDLDRGGIIFWNDGTTQVPNFVRRSPGYSNEGQSNVTFIDIDADGDLDFFSGEGYREMRLDFAENTGTPEVPNFVFRTGHYQNLDFGIPFNFDFGDLDGDSDYDLLVCRNGGPVSYYENTGTPDSAYFALADSNYLSFRDTTDWTEAPEFADIDADGDLDLFLAGTFAHLNFLENIGFPTQAEFVQRYDTSFFYVFPGVGNGALGNSVDIDGDGDDDLAPGPNLLLNESQEGDIRFRRVDMALPWNLGSFADMDADGDYDYICPGWPSVIKYFENTGNSSWPAWGPAQNLFPADGRLGVVWSVTIGDLDGDGDQDLLAAHSGADLMSYYRNNGTPQADSFTYGGRFLLPNFVQHDIFDMLLGDIDLDGDLDLLIGESQDNSYLTQLYLYRNDGNRQAPNWTYITNDFQHAISEHRNGSVAPCLADIDKDGDKDLVITSNSLGMQAFLKPQNPDAVEDGGNRGNNSDISSLRLQSYPNPSNSSVTILVNAEKGVSGRVEIFNMLGQAVSKVFEGEFSSGENAVIWHFGGQASGMYFIKVTTERQCVFGKINLVK